MNRNTRRQFLKGLGGFTLALPALPSLLTEAFAQAMTPKPRFISMGASLGVYRKLWQPSIEPTLDLGNGAVTAKLTDIAGDLSPVFTNTHFGTLKSKISFLRGLDQCFAGGHNSGILAASQSGITLDYVLARSTQFYPQAPNVRNLIVTAHPNSNYGGPSYSASLNANGSYGRVAAIARSQTVFDLAFKGQINTNGSPTQPSAADLKKVVDRVYEDYKNVSTSRKISSEDKKRLEDHMSLLSQVENDLAKPSAASCTPPTLTKWTGSSTAEFEAAVKQQIDILVAALACGATRIATFNFPRGLYDGLVGGGYHDKVSHSSTNDAGFLKVHTVYAKHIAYFIKSLDSIMESDGKSLLYHSLMLYNNTLTFGNYHAACDQPVFLAGNAGGAFDPGRLICYRQRPFAKIRDSKGENIGRPYNQLLVSILQMMKLAPADYEQNGQPGFGSYSGPSTLMTKHAPFTTITEKRKALPGLKA